MTSPAPDSPSRQWIASATPEPYAAQEGAEVHFAAHGPIAAAHGCGGLRLAARDLRRIALWQLTGPMERLLVGGQRDDAPSAEAAPIWLFDPSGPSPGYQDASDHTRGVRVYHPAAFPGDQRDQIASLDEGQPGHLAVPRYGPGDRVYAEFNPQSGRWEILGPAEDLWRFELKTALVPGGDPDVPSTAEAWLVVYDAAENRYVTTGVEFQVADFLGLWEAEPGCRGYAKRLADSHAGAGWEVLAMNTAPSGSG